MESIKVAIIIMVLMAVPMNSRAYESVRYSGATEIYRFTDVFLGGALLYRPKNSVGLSVVDLSDATVEFIKRGPPHDCVQLVIRTTDGYIFGDCVKSSTKE